MASKLPWFKHYNTSHEGQSLSELWAKKDFETIAFYWSLLEMVSRYEDLNERGKWSSQLSIFKLKLNLNSQRSRKLLVQISQTFQVKVEWKSDESFTVFIPNWLKLQETRGGKNLPKLNQKGVRSKKREDRGEIVDVKNMSHTEKHVLSMTPVAQTLKSFFNDNKMSQLEKFIPEILKYFVNVESFDNWYQGLVKSKAFPKDQDFANQTRYVVGSLKRELGLIPGEETSA